MTKSSWVQNPITGKLVPKEEWSAPHTGAYIQGDIDSFVSPIDGSVITDRGQLRRHNRRHGVTNSADYSHEFLLKRSTDRVNRMMGQTQEAKRERIDLIKRAIHERST